MYETVYATPPEQRLAHNNHNFRKATALIESNVIEETTT